MLAVDWGAGGGAGRVSAIGWGGWGGVGYRLGGPGGVSAIDWGRQERRQEKRVPSLPNLGSVLVGGT